MKINPNIFKAYDIRGVYPVEINGKTAYLVGRAFVEFLKKTKPKIAVGRDNRLSSSDLHKNLIKGLQDSGANVIDIGLSSSPMLYFAVANYGFDGGINVTASHNPKKYNGFKLVREKAIAIGQDSGLPKIYDLTRRSFVEPKSRGVVMERRVIKNYIAFNLKELDAGNLKPLEIIIDTANAVPGILIKELLRKIPGKSYHIFRKLDGNFPNHLPDPSKKENLLALCAEVKKKKADFGVAFDGDGDRIVFVDEKGKIIPSDMIIALMAEFILKNTPGGKILYDVRSSRSVKEVIEEKGGLPVIWKVGHAFISKKMREEDIIFGGEFAGHFYHKKHYFRDAPIFVLLKVLEIISAKEKTLSQLIKPYQRYFHSGEINFEVKDKLGKIKELKKRFNNGKIIEIDGLRVDFKDWWFNVRPSNTEPLLRLVVEADTKSLMQEKTHLLSDIIHS